MPKTPKLILIIFCLFLALPTVGQWLNFDFFTRQTENRNWVERPKFSWAIEDIEKFPGKYQAYYNENFGFRNTLVRANSFIRYRLLGISPTSLVIPGRDGWLYFNADGVIPDCRGISQFNEEQLFHWSAALSLKRYWLEQQGIRHLLIFPPNKCTIYPEYLPAGYDRVRDGSALDDFISYMRRNTDLDIIDLRAVLLAQKNQHRLYYRTDPHWNNYGAFLGYTEIMTRLSSYFPKIQPMKADDFVISMQPHPPGDLAMLIGATGFLSDEEYNFIPKKPFTAVMSEKNVNYNDPFTMTKDENGLPRAVIFRDSFFTLLTPFFSENFSLGRYIWRKWDEKIPMDEIVEKYKPQIVIEECLERLMKYDVPKDVLGKLSEDVIGKIISNNENENLPLSEVKPIYQVEIKETDKGLSVKSNGDDPQLLLPDSDLINMGNNGILFVATIDSKKETLAKLFYKTKNDPVYSDLKTKTAVLNKGINEIKMLIFDRDVVGSLRFDPTNLPGDELTIKKIAIYDISKNYIDRIISNNKKDVLSLMEIKPLSQVEIKNTDSGLFVKSSGEDTQLLLPESSLITRENKGILFLATIESKIETQAQLFYKTRNDPDYSELKSKTADLKKGINKIKMLIYDQDVIGPLRFDPTNITGSELIIKQMIICDLSNP